MQPWSVIATREPITIAITKAVTHEKAELDDGLGMVGYQCAMNVIRYGGE
jgi:hypothetical protein